MKKTAFYLISLLALVFVSIGANAQGGLAPLVNSTHIYTVTPGNVLNTLAWTVSPATGYTINSGAGTASINIKWTTAATYTLTFTETNGSCSTVKTSTVVVSADSFDVITPLTLAAVCNGSSGTANPPSTTTSNLSFSVTMATGVPTFNPNWEFNFTLTPGSGATIAGISSSAGTLTGAGPYNVTAIPSASGTGSITISLTLTAGSFASNTAAVLITSAKELTYQTPSNNSGNKGAMQTVNAIPNTSAISAN